MAKHQVLVTGATGTQGGAVARLLRKRGHDVRGMSRKPDSPAARELATLGIEVVAGEFTDRVAMDRALRGVDSVFSMATPFEGGLSAEIRQGTTVADAAKVAGAFLVYSSVGNADRKTGIPHFDSKFEIEQHIRSIGADATIIAPVYFMENLRFLQTQLRDNLYPIALSPTRPLAQIAIADIAAVAAAVIEDRARYAGKRYDLAGDELTGATSTEILSRVVGRTFRYVQVPLDAVRATMGEDAAKMYDWFERVGYTVDRAALAREFPDVRWTSFEAWARTFDWSTFLAG